MSRMDPVIAAPGHCTAADLDSFCALVRQGDEVEGQGLPARVKRAKALVFLKIDGTLVGIAALKNPSKDYRDGVFQKAGVPDAATRYGLELGWVFVVPDHQGNKYSLVLSAAALSQANRTPTFATTRLDNVAMQRTLEHLAFRRLGDSWRSERGKRPRLVLYVT